MYDNYENHIIIMIMTNMIIIITIYKLLLFLKNINNI